MTTATAQSFANIAFTKYWSNRDNTLRLPMNGSMSNNLDGLYTRTAVSFQPSLPFDKLLINGHEVMGRIESDFLYPRYHSRHGSDAFNTVRS